MLSKSVYRSPKRADVVRLAYSAAATSSSRPPSSEPSRDPLSGSEPVGLDVLAVGLGRPIKLAYQRSGYKQGFALEPSPDEGAQQGLTSRAEIAARPLIVAPQLNGKRSVDGGAQRNSPPASRIACRRARYAAHLARSRTAAEVRDFRSRSRCRSRSILAGSSRQRAFLSVPFMAQSMARRKSSTRPQPCSVPSAQGSGVPPGVVCGR